MRSGPQIILQIWHPLQSLKHPQSSPPECVGRRCWRSLPTLRTCSRCSPMARTSAGLDLLVLDILSASNHSLRFFRCLYSHAWFLVGVLGLLADTVGNFRKIPTMLADHVEKNGLQGKMKYSLFVGASSGAETENRWAALNMIERRSPHQVGKQIAKGINKSDIKFFDKHLSMFPVDLVYVSFPLELWIEIIFMCNIGILYKRSAEQ